MLNSEIPYAGARHPQKFFRISECDAFLLFLYLSLPANRCTPSTYNSLFNGVPQNHQHTNPHCAPRNALKLAKTQPRVQCQILQTPCFLLPTSSLPAERG
jgi:hypothetical protein